MSHSHSGSPLLANVRRPIVLVLACLSASVLPVLAFAASLDEALALRDQGRLFSALAELQALQTDNPDSARLKLETAVVHVQLKQYDRALALFDEVLAADLPDKVRINTQLLRVRTLRQQQRERDDRFSPFLSAGASVSEANDAPVIRPDASVGLGHRTRLPALDVGGYPVYRLWRNQVDLFVLREPDGENDWRLSAYSEMPLRRDSVTVNPAAGVEVDTESAEPVLNATVQWRPGTGGHLRLYTERRFGADTATVRLAGGLRGPASLRLNGHVQQRFIDSGVDYRQWEGSVTVDRTLKTTLGVQYDAATDGSRTLTEPFASVRWPLNDTVSVNGRLSYFIDSLQQNTGYGRLGIQWTP